MRTQARRAAAAVAAALVLASCSVAGHNIGISAPVQCPASAPSLHPGHATPQKFALHDDYVRVDICGYRSGSGMLRLEAKLRRTDKAWIGRVVAALNALPVPSAGNYNCPTLNGEFDLLRLYTGNRRTDVHVDLSACRFVVGPHGMDGIDTDGGVGLLLQGALA